MSIYPYWFQGSNDCAIFNGIAFQYDQVDVLQ